MCGWLRGRPRCKRVDGYIAALNAPGDGLQLADIDARGPVTLPYKSNFTQTEFEQAVRKVSEDPAAAKRYSESYRKAGA